MIDKISNKEKEKPKKKLINRKSDPDFKPKPEKEQQIDYKTEQLIIKKQKGQEKQDAINFMKQSKIKTQMYKQLQRSMQVGDSTPMEEEKIVPKQWREQLENDHLPIFNIDLDTLKKRDKIIHKDLNQLDENDITLLSNKERVDLAKCKVDEIKRQMQQQAETDKLDLATPGDLVSSVTSAEEFKALPETKKAKYINDLCNSVIKTPRADLSKIEILVAIADNRVLLDQQWNKLALTSLTLLVLEVTPEQRLRDFTEAEMEVRLTKEVQATRGFETKFKAVYLSFVKLLNIYLFAKDQEFQELKITSSICICNIFQRLSHFNQSEELLKLVIQIQFNKTTHASVHTKASGTLMNLAKSEAGTDCKLRLNLLIELQKQVKKKAKNTRIPFEIFDILKEIKLQAINDPDDEDEKMNSLQLKRKREEDQLKGLTHKQKRMAKKIEKDKFMRNAKKKKTEAILKKKANAQVDKDLAKLHGDSVSAKLAKTQLKRILEIATKMALWLIVNYKNQHSSLVENAIIYLTLTFDMLNADLVFEVIEKLKHLCSGTEPKPVSLRSTALLALYKVVNGLGTAQNIELRSALQVMGNILDQVNTLLWNKLHLNQVEPLISAVVEAADLALLKRRELDKAAVYYVFLKLLCTRVLLEDKETKTGEVDKAVRQALIALTKSMVSLYFFLRDRVEGEVEDVQLPSRIEWSCSTDLAKFKIKDGAHNVQFQLFERESWKKTVREILKMM